LYDAELEKEKFEETEDQSHSDDSPPHRRSEGRRREQEAKEAAEDAARTNHEADEWEAKTKTSLKNILCLRDKIATMSASIQNIDQEHRDKLARETREKERRNYKTTIWDQDSRRIERENARRSQERLQQRSSFSIRLVWSKNDLLKIETQYRAEMQLQSHHRRSLAQRLERDFTKKMEIAQQEKHDRMDKKKAEEAVRKAKEDAAGQEKARAMQEESDRIRRERLDRLQENQRAEARERGQKERDQRQQLLSTISKQERKPAFSNQSQTQRSWRSGATTTTPESPRVPNPQEKEPIWRGQHKANAWPRKGENLFKSGNSASTSDPDRTTWRPGSKPRASGNEEESCRHNAFWSKIRCHEQCSNCPRFCKAFIFECPKCNIRACDTCRSVLRQGSH